MRWIVAMLLVLIVLLLGAGFVWWQNAGFSARIAGLRDEAIRAAGPGGEVVLPTIVRAYAEKAGGTVGGPAFVHLKHHASLATDRNRPPMTIEADQWLSSYRPEFVWHGKGAMFGLPVAVVDSFVGGSGLLEARLLGTVAVAKGVGAAFDRGELQRYLSELPLHPDAILNNDALTWRQVDERTVEVSGSTAGGIGQRAVLLR